MSTDHVRARLIRRLRERRRAWETQGAPPPPAPALPAAPPLSLLSEGREEVNLHGRFQAIRFPLSRLGVDSRPWAHRWPSGSVSGDGPPPPQDWLGLDLETLGISGRRHPLFLIGLAHWHQGELEIVQLFARGLEEEAAVVDAARRWLDRHRWLVTFNGRSFDGPYLVERARHHGLPTLSLEPHLDVLLLARRQVGHRYGNCRLQTLETHLCGRPRQGDIPSSQVPNAYRRYLDGGRTDEIDRILYHNALDLLTTAELMFHFHDRSATTR